VEEAIEGDECISIVPCNCDCPVCYGVMEPLVGIAATLLPNLRMWRVVLLGFVNTLAHDK
jgi:hypothetical protein